MHKPTWMQDGSPDEDQVLQLAEELSTKFSIESLEMYDALKEVWGNANKTDFDKATRVFKVSQCALSVV